MDERMTKSTDQDQDTKELLSKCPQTKGTMKCKKEQTSTRQQTADRDGGAGLASCSGLSAPSCFRFPGTTVLALGFRPLHWLFLNF